MAGLGCKHCDYTGSVVVFEGMGDREMEFDCPNCSPDPDLDDVLNDYSIAFDDIGDVPDDDGFGWDDYPDWEGDRWFLNEEGVSAY